MYLRRLRTLMDLFHPEGVLEEIVRDTYFVIRDDAVRGEALKVPRLGNSLSPGFWPIPSMNFETSPPYFVIMDDAVGGEALNLPRFIHFHWNFGRFLL